MRYLQTLAFILICALNASAEYPPKPVPVPKLAKAEAAPIGSLSPAGQLRAAVLDLITRVPRDRQADTRYISLYAMPADKLRAWTIGLQALLNTVSLADAPGYVEIVPDTGGRLLRVRLAKFRWTKDAFSAVARRDNYFHSSEVPFREAEFVRQVIGVAQDPKTLAAEIIVEGTFLMRSLLQTDGFGDNYYDLLYGEKRFGTAKAAGGEPILPPDPGAEPRPPSPRVWDDSRPWTDGKRYPKGSFEYVDGDEQRAFVAAHDAWKFAKEKRAAAVAVVPRAVQPGGKKKDFPANVTEWEEFWGVADFNKFETDRGFAIKRGEVAIGGVNVKGGKGSFVAYNDRVIAVSRVGTGYALRTYDSLSTQRGQDYLEDPLNVLRGRIKFDAGELLVNLPNGLQAALLINGAGDRVEFADSRAARNTVDSKQVTVLTQIGCLQCHAPDGGFISPTSRKVKESLQAGLKLNVKNEEDQIKAAAFFLGWEKEEEEIRGRYFRALTAVTRMDPRDAADKGLTPGQLVAVLVDFRDWYDDPVTMETAAAYLGQPPPLLFPIMTLSPTAGLNLIAVGKSMPRAAWDARGARDAQNLLALIRLGTDLAFRFQKE